MEVLYEDKKTGITAGINDDGNLFLGNNDSGYNLPDTPENRELIKKDFKRYTQEHESAISDKGNSEYYKFFYAGDGGQDKEAEEFRKNNKWHKVWGSDSQGLNGDTWIVYRDINDLPKWLRDYARGQEEKEKTFNEQSSENDNISDLNKQKSFIKEITSDTDVTELLNDLKTGIKELMTSERYKEFLEFKSSLYQYSVNNCILISLQKPDATYIGSYGFWKNQNRYVKKGEKGIKIFAPVTGKRTVETSVLDEKKNPILDEKGDSLKQKSEKTVITGFKLTTVFDVSQTEGEPLPNILNTLSGNSSKAEKLIETIISICPNKIIFEEITSGANGYYSLDDKNIVIKAGMSKDQTAKTLIHEYTHSKLHNTLIGSRHEAEIQAESTAYIVSKRFGLDTSEYSFGYIKQWAGNKDIEDFQNTLKIISDTSKEIIIEIQDKLTSEYELYKSNEKKLIKKEVLKNGFKATDKVIDNIFNLNNSLGEKHSLEEISHKFKNIDNFKGTKHEKSLLDDIGKELQGQEISLNNKSNKKVDIEFSLD